MFEIIYSCLSGLVLSLVALLPRVWRTGQKGIILSVSTTYLVAALCYSLLAIYGQVLTVIAGESYQFAGMDAPITGYTMYMIDEKMHHNRDAIATELWKRTLLLLPHSQKHCFTSDITVCDLADQIESKNQIWQDILLANLSIIPSALTCIAMTRHLIKKQTAAVQNPKQPAHIRKRKAYLIIPLLLIWSCLTLGTVSFLPIVGIPTLNSYYAENVWSITGYDGPFPVTHYRDAPTIPGTTLWVGPWRSTLAPGIGIGLGAIAAIEGTLLVFLKKKAG
jgi:hypothetical protein